MKKLLVGLLVLGCFSAFADEVLNCQLDQQESVAVDTAYDNNFVSNNNHLIVSIDVSNYQNPRQIRVLAYESSDGRYVGRKLVDSEQYLAPGKSLKFVLRAYQNDHTFICH